MIPFLIVSQLFFQSIEAPAIVNGIFKPSEPKEGEFPYHANLMLLYKKEYHSFCGGSLIHPRWVLTAAHCIQLDSNHPAIQPQSIFVSLGSVLRNSKGSQILGVEKTILHPTYLETDRNDIALLKLKTSANLGSNVKIIKLHTNNKEDLIGKTVFLTGFGITNDLQDTPERLRKAKLHVNTFNKCFSEKEFANIEICATSTMAEGKACKGDSGGPLVFQHNGHLVQVGITSHLSILPFCRFQFNNSVYTRVSAYIEWLSNTTGINFNKFPF